MYNIKKVNKTLMLSVAIAILMAASAMAESTEVAAPVIANPVPAIVETIKSAEGDTWNRYDNGAWTCIKGTTAMQAKNEAVLFNGVAYAVDENGVMLTSDAIVNNRACKIGTDGKILSVDNVQITNQLDIFNKINNITQVAQAAVSTLAPASSNAADPYGYIAKYREIGSENWHQNFYKQEFLRIADAKKAGLITLEQMKAQQAALNNVGKVIKAENQAAREAEATRREEERLAREQVRAEKEAQQIREREQAKAEADALAKKKADEYNKAEEEFWKMYNALSDEDQQRLYPQIHAVATAGRRFIEGSEQDEEQFEKARKGEDGYGFDKDGFLTKDGVRYGTE